MEVEIESENTVKRNSESVSFLELTEIPSLDTSLSYNSFFKNYLQKNLPCKIKDICASWECAKYWVEESYPAFQYLEERYGRSRVVVYDCKKKYFNSQKCENSLFSNFLKYWQKYIKNNYNEQMPLSYLKDWHLKNQFPKDDFYVVPLYFASDWLNEYLCANYKDDYRFVYMGPKGTW